MTNQRNRQSSLHTHARRGTTLMLFLVLLPLLIVLLGFSIDFAHMEAARGELRRSADLSAKAAAASLAGNDEVFALEVARQIAAENPVAGEPLVLNDEHVLFGRSHRNADGSLGFTAGVTPFNAVRVIGDRTVGSPSGPIRKYFGGLYNSPVFSPRVGATAALLETEICLVLDRSSSMKLGIDGSIVGGPGDCQPPAAGSRWLALQDAVVQFLDRLDITAANERVGIVTFGSDITACGVTYEASTIDQPLTATYSSLRMALADRSSSVWVGNTDIASGIELGQQMLTTSGGSDTASKIMIVFTDGNYTEANPVPYAEFANANGITIHTITFGDNANEADMDSVAQAGKGMHLHAVTSAELAAAFQNVGAASAQLIE